MGGGQIFEILVWAAFVVVLYPYFIYPAITGLLSLIIKNPVKPDVSYKPEISILISAYNEEKLIRESLESIFKSNYPKEKIRVLVVSDGSTDRTAEFVRSVEEEYDSIELFELERSGKNRALNFLIERSSGEVVFFMDADTKVGSDTIGKLIRTLSDPDVGTAIPYMKYIDKTENAGSMGEGLYQKIETYIRISESKIKTTFNSLGQFYGVKKEFVKKIPKDNICDDFFPLITTMKARKRVIFVPEAVVYEFSDKSLENEFARRIRVASCSIGSLIEAGRLHLPIYLPESFFLFSHKTSRFLLPIALIYLIVSLFLLPRDSLMFDVLFYGQIAFYSLALLGAVFEKINIGFKPLRFIVYFVAMNAGFIGGAFKFAFGSSSSLWDRNAGKRK